MVDGYGEPSDGAERRVQCPCGAWVVIPSDMKSVTCPNCGGAVWEHM
jgi:hypothetical protein